jgi:ATP synthase protein I
VPKSDDHLSEAPGDALSTLDARLKAVEARRAARFQRKPGVDTSDGYRLLADMIGGVLVGLGLGWLLDRYAGIKPWGMIGGLLIGLGFSIFSVVRKASQLSKAAPPPVSNSEPVETEFERRDD